MWLILVSLITLLLYFWTKKRHNYWKEKSVPYLKPLPLVGNLGPNLFRNTARAHLIQEWYRTYPNERFVGYYEFFCPKLLIRDPELIKTLAVKNYETFFHRGNTIPEGIDPLWDKNLIGLKDKEEWRNIRSTISPAFTSSKMKIIFDVMRNYTKQMMDYFQSQGGMVTIKVQDIFAKITTDIIATTAFGIDCNSLENKKNVFLQMGQEVKSTISLKNFRFLILHFCPFLAKILKIRLYSESLRTFFLKIITETIKVRTERGIIRPDMIHLLMEARKGRLNYEDSTDDIPESGFAVVEESELGRTQKKHKPVLTDEDITAQALVFFVGGSDSVQNFMNFALYELAVNPDVQKKLQQQVDSIRKSCPDDLTYESLMAMNYLDMVVSETLRKWPGVPMVGRTSSKPFTIESPEGKSVYLEAGSRITFPVYALHRCPDYYPNPEQFDPERFNDENKKNIKPYTFLPFGVGPRSCIGSRLFLLETKLVLAEFVSKFEVVPVDKTQIPLKIDKKSMLLQPATTVWLGLKPRMDIV